MLHPDAAQEAFSPQRVRIATLLRGEDLRVTVKPWTVDRFFFFYI